MIKKLEWWLLRTWMDIVPPQEQVAVMAWFERNVIIPRWMREMERRGFYD